MFVQIKARFNDHALATFNEQIDYQVTVQSSTSQVNSLFVIIQEIIISATIFVFRHT